MYKQVSLATGLAMAITGSAFAGTTYGPGPGGPIPDATTSNATPGVFNSVINVTDVGNIISLNSVTLTFSSHTWAGDLEVILTAPNGDNVHLFSRVRGSGSVSFGDSSDLVGPYSFVNSGGASFDAAASAVDGNGTIANGTYNISTTPGGTPAPGPDADTFDVFLGDNINGDWTLTIKDWAEGDEGTLATWTFDATIPGPGSLALLGLAGLAGFGRRRRR